MATKKQPSFWDTVATLAPRGKPAQWGTFNKQVKKGVKEVVGISDAKRAIKEAKKGNVVGAGKNAILAASGLIPGIGLGGKVTGKVASKVAPKIGSAVTKQANKLWNLGTKSIFPSLNKPAKGGILSKLAKGAAGAATSGAFLVPTGVIGVDSFIKGLKGQPLGAPKPETDRMASAALRARNQARLNAEKKAAQTKKKKKKSKPKEITPYQPVEEFEEYSPTFDPGGFRKGEEKDRPSTTTQPSTQPSTTTQPSTQPTTANPWAGNEPTLPITREPIPMIQNLEETPLQNVPMPSQATNQPFSSTVAQPTASTPTPDKKALLGQAQVLNAQYLAGLQDEKAVQAANDAAIREAFSQRMIGAQSRAADIMGGRAPSIFGQAVTGARRQFLTEQAGETQRTLQQQDALRRQYSRAIEEAYTQAGLDALERAQQRSEMAARIREIGIA